jgi:hypothetical protein
MEFSFILDLRYVLRAITAQLSKRNIVLLLQQLLALSDWHGTHIV